MLTYSLSQKYKKNSSTKLGTGAKIEYKNHPISYAVSGGDGEQDMFLENFSSEILY